MWWLLLIVGEACYCLSIWLCGVFPSFLLPLLLYAICRTVFSSVCVARTSIVIDQSELSPTHRYKTTLTLVHTTQSVQRSAVVPQTDNQLRSLRSQ